MPRRRSPIGPLLDMNDNGLAVLKLQGLANKLARAKLSLAVLTETTSVDEHGTVSRDLMLCHECRGNCCSVLMVPLTAADASRLARHVGTTATKLPLLPIDGDEADADELVGYLTKGEQACPYFDGRCTVHAGRPDACRLFGLQACLDAETFAPHAR